MPIYQKVSKFLPAARYEHAGLQVNFVSFLPGNKRLFRDNEIK